MIGNSSVNNNLAEFSEIILGLKSIAYPLFKIYKSRTYLYFFYLNLINIPIATTPITTPIITKYLTILKLSSFF